MTTEPDASDLIPIISLDQPQFLNVLNALPDATLVVNSSGDIIFASIKTEATYGYKPEELTGKKIEILVPNAYRKFHVNHRDSYFDNPKIRMMGNGQELQGQRKDGSVFPAEISLNYINSGEGVIAICSVRDVSDRKITEQLLINDERFQLLMQNAPAAIAMFDRDMRYLVVSKRWLEDYRLTGQDIIGRSHYEVFPDLPDEWKTVHQRCLAGETLRAEEDLFHKADGTTDWVRWEMRPWQANDGKIGGAILFTEVITQKKLTEIELHKIAEQFRAIFDNAEIGFAIGDLETGKYYLANQAYSQLVGYAADELIQSSFKTLIHPDDLETDMNEVRRIFTEGLQSVNLVSRYIRKNGEPVWVRKIVQRFPSNTGEPLLLMVSVMDHTELKKAEDELKASYENLERLVKKRTHELELAKQEAERADNVKTRFLTAASHDLRQPLQSAGLFLSVLSQMNNNPQHQEVCMGMQQALETMGTLLNGLLDISKFQSGKVVPDNQDFSLDAMLSRIVTDNQQQAMAKCLKLSYKTHDCNVHSDPDLLERIIENLVANAIRYTQEGGICISCDCTDEAVRISVSDSGIGIPPEEMDNIFAEYYQLNNPGRDCRKGLGLGLAIVKHLAQILGHQLEVQSQLGKGSVFTIVVTRGRQRQHHDSEKLFFSKPGMQHTIDVLFIDDDPMIVKAMQILFSQTGIILHTAESGEQAIEQVRVGVRPDVIVSDYRLPGCNGIEAINAIRTLVVDAVPAIIISGDTSLQRIEDEKLPKCKTFLKPVDAQKLVNIIFELTQAK